MSKADGADTTCKAEKVMASVESVTSEDAFTPPPWEQCFAPNQEAVERGGASD